MWPAQNASYGVQEGLALKEWASWHALLKADNARHYSLEVTQNPIRARMCGFGDKDRRPLAPAAVAKLVVKDKDDRVIPPDHIDTAFFVVLVDLWSQDGSKAHNLVRVPVPNGVTSRRYRVQRAGSQPSWQRNNGTPFPNQEGNPSGVTTFTPTPVDSLPTNAFATGESSPVHPNNSPTMKRRRPTARRGTAESNDGQPLTSWTNEVRRALSENSEEIPAGVMDGGHTASQSASAIEEVPTQPFYPTQQGTLYQHAFQPELIAYSSYMPPAYPPMTQDPTSAYTEAPASTSFPTGTSADAEVSNQTYGATSSMQSYPNGGSTQAWPVEEPVEHARTLIGPLAAGAQRLKDDNEKSGIFFLFQDLSVRIEGTFRLRMRLVNVGSPPAPDPGSSQVGHQTSEVLAQVFTEPFIVYSAKRFPGVPSPTSLSQKLLSQGLKIPGRTRSPTKSTSRKRRRKSDGEEWVPEPRASDSSEE